MKTTSISLKSLHPTYKDRESNPNKLDEDRYAGLKALMAEKGCLQPLLIRLVGKQYWIIDGHNRYWVALELGWDEILCIVFECDDAEAGALSLAMNRLRGDLDMTLSAEVMRDVLIESGWDSAKLALNTGFSEKEVEALLNQAKTYGEADLGEVGAGTPGDDEPAPVDKPFVLEVSFASKDELRLVRRKLRKAAGKGGDLGRGLLTVLGEEVGD